MGSNGSSNVVLNIMLKINTVTMKAEIEDILMNSYDKFGNFDEKPRIVTFKDNCS